jgi:hypothetical protein
MPSFPHTLIGLDPFANLGCQIVFTKTAVSVIHPEGHTILEGWQEQDGPRLWHFPLKSNKPSLPVTVFTENYEEPSPRGSAANYFTLPLTSPIQCPAALPLPVPACLFTPAPTALPGMHLQTHASGNACVSRRMHLDRMHHQLKPIPARGARPLMRPARPAWSYICMEQPRPWR